MDGKANRTILSLRQKIVDILSSNGILVFAQATEGDNMYNIQNEETLVSYIQIVITEGIDKAIGVFASDVQNHSLHLGDMLHMLKIVRARLFSPVPIVFTLHNTTFKVDTEKMRKVLKLGKVLCDESSTGKMKDYYPLILFDLENVQKLIENECFPQAMYLLPYALWSTAVRNADIHRDTRIKVLSMSFSIFYSLFIQSNFETRDKGITIKPCKTSTAIYFADDALLIRAMNATFTTAVALKAFPDVRLERIGTHVLENFFGKVRQMCDNHVMIHGNISFLHVRKP